MKKDLGHGEIWRSQHRSRGEGSRTQNIEIVDDKRSKKVAKNKKNVKIAKGPREIRRSQRRLRSEGRGISKITRIFENRGEYLYRPLLFWDQEIRQKNCTLLEIVEGICIAPSFSEPKKKGLSLIHEAKYQVVFFTKNER